MRNCLFAILFWIAEVVQAHMGLPVASSHEPVAGPPCDGCEAVFQRMPARPTSSTQLAPLTEPGDRLRLSGTVTDAAGRSRPGIVVYAYQTNRQGRYPKDKHLEGAAYRHGRLRGWTTTDAAGRYEFRTIRPGNYPVFPEPQHIHMQIIEPGRCTYYLGDVLFSDDRHLDDERRLKQQSARGGSGIVTPKGSAAAGWTATRNIQLGLNVPGYEATCKGPG